MIAVEQLRSDDFQSSTAEQIRWWRPGYRAYAKVATMQRQPSARRPSQPRPKASDPADRLLTVPNVLSLLRLAGVPLFLWLLLGPHYDLLAVLVLACRVLPTGWTANSPGC